MVNTAKPLRTHRFDQHSPLHQLPCTRQRAYLIRYLTDLGASSVLEESNYFDRDYLAEFSAFYSRSSTGYPNICRRLHFFSGPSVTRRTIKGLAAGSARVQKRLQGNYLGFIVIRPIPAAPFGRTVLRWYEDCEPDTPRITTPSRNYTAHIAGVPLYVHGLAWQQQDSGVGACATVGLWTMLHSSAFDDHHAIPTTTQITEAAHRTASLGSRVYPSQGLNDYQIREAIKEHSLAPLLCEQDLEKGFSRERFSSLCAAFLRSGYPILIGGHIGNGQKHAVCAVGFRSCAPPSVPSGQYNSQDSSIPRLYIHDDNLGPGVRFDIQEPIAGGPIKLKATTPSYSGEPEGPHPVDGYFEIQPDLLLVATHEEIKTSPFKLYHSGLQSAQNIVYLLDPYIRSQGGAGIGLTTSARYIKLSEYLNQELGEMLGEKNEKLCKVRLALTETVPPMSFHLGVIRIGLDDATPLVDILYDTTDSDNNHPAFAFVYYQEIMRSVLDIIQQKTPIRFGIAVQAC